MTVKLTKAQASLARLARWDRFDMRFMSRKEAVADGLGEDFDRCRKAGLIKSAQYETTVPAEDWLSSPEGRAALLSPEAPASSKEEGE